MKYYRIITITILLVVLTCQCGYSSQFTDAIKSLEKAYPQFSWQKDNVVVIDINADGFNDIAVLGYTKDKAAVGVVFGSPSKSFKTKILDFTRGHDTQRGICGKTARLKVEKQSVTPKEALGEFPQGYHICDKCYEIEVDDDLCDPINIYWNYKTNELDWWRA